MLKKHYIGINPHVANSGSRDQSLTGIGGPRVYVDTVTNIYFSKAYKHGTYIVEFWLNGTRFIRMKVK